MKITWCFFMFPRDIQNVVNLGLISHYLCFYNLNILSFLFLPLAIFRRSYIPCDFLV